MLGFLTALLEVRKTSSSSSVSVSRLVSVVSGGEVPCWTPLFLNAALLLPRTDFRDLLEMLDFNVFLFELNLEFAGVLEADEADVTLLSEDAPGLVFQWCQDS